MAVVDNALGLAFRAFNRLRQANFNMTVNANRIAYVIAQLARGGIACIIAAMVCLAFDVDNHFIHSAGTAQFRSEEHTSELQSRGQLVCRLMLEKTKDTVLPLCTGACRRGGRR